MNRKNLYVFGLLLLNLALPALVPAQNLILDGGFDSGTMVRGLALKGTSAYGQWAGVHGEYGWTIVETGSNKVLSACGKGFAREKQWLNQSKLIFQEVSGKSMLPGSYTLKFKCQCASSLLTVGHMEVSVAQRTEGPAEIIVHIEKPDDKKPKGYNILKEQSLLTGQPTEITGPGMWRTVEIPFEVPAGGKSLLVMFYGMVDTGSFRIDDVSLTRKGGSPVPPEKTAVSYNIVEKLLEKPVAPATAAVVTPKQASAPVTPKQASAPVTPKQAPAPVTATPAPVKAPVPVVVAALQPAPVPVPVEKPVPTPMVVEKPAPAAVPAPVPVTVTAAPLPRPVPVPVRPPVENLILSGDFSGASLALPTATGDTTAELSGRWLRSVTSPWEISPYGGNMGSYARAAASRETSLLLYVASDAKRSAGSYLLNFDYILADPSDVLGVKVFVSDRDITIGTDGGNFRMNNPQRPADMVILPTSASWIKYSMPVELGSGYNYIYVLFTGSGIGNTGIDNISLSPRRR